jgi:hypothetical protein
MNDAGFVREKCNLGMNVKGMGKGKEPTADAFR